MTQQSQLLGILPEKIIIEKDMYPSVHCSTIYNSWNMEATWMSLDRWMDKEVVVYIHNVVLLNHKKECIWVSSSEVGEPRTYLIEWCESEREGYILYSNTYIWNLEKWYWRIYLQGNNGETDIENRLVLLYFWTLWIPLTVFPTTWHGQDVKKYSSMCYKKCLASFCSEEHNGHEGKIWGGAFCFSPVASLLTSNLVPSAISLMMV